MASSEIQNNQENKHEKVDDELQNSSTQEKETAKTHGEILKQQIIEGQETYDKPLSSVFLSSLTAGLEIGFSFLLLCTVYSFFNGKVEEDTIFKLMSFAYPIGFILVILGQSILFTEQTSLLALPVLNKKRSVFSLIKLWGMVIAGNLIGGYLMAFLLIWIGPELGIFEVEAVESIAKHVTDHSNLVIFVSAILAGWLMGLLSWLVTSSKGTMSRILIIYMITFVLSFAGLHHSIVGNVEVFSGLIATDVISFADYLYFQVLALLGNAVGGVFFVALLKYRAFVYSVSGFAE